MGSILKFRKSARERIEERDEELEDQRMLELFGVPHSGEGCHCHLHGDTSEYVTETDPT